jgi:hypothetical protein
MGSAASGPIYFHCLIHSADQTIHRNIHKHACVTTKKAHTEFLKEETLLWNGPADGFILSPPVFEKHAGGFWDILGTRNYIRARLNFVDTVLSKFPCHHVTVQTTLNHLMDVLRLNHSNNMGLQNIVPSLMLRLRHNQDAYSFVKWWATCVPSHYSGGNMELPYLDIKDADILEEPK